MSKYLNHTELIGSYLEGNMSPNEMMEFENQLHTDPVLRSEFELQQDIIKSLKDFRKSQLKARLDQVPVTMGPGTFIGVKTAAAMVLSGIIGIGGYLYFNAQSEVPVESPVENQITLQEEEVADLQNADQLVAEQLPAIPDEAVELEVSEPVAAKRSAENIKAQDPEVTAIDIEDEADQTETEAEEFTPVINSPKLIDPELDETATEEALEMPTAALAQKELVDNRVVEVENARKDDSMFHYQYYSGKLYLYGDFRDKPYEILELNSANGKRLYMFYDNTYYNIQNDQKEITPLQELKNQDIIKKLEIIQANK